MVFTVEIHTKGVYGITQCDQAVRKTYTALNLAEIDTKGIYGITQCDQAVGKTKQSEKLTLLWISSQRITFGDVFTAKIHT